MLVAKFQGANANRDYLDFINHCFANSLISGVDVSGLYTLYVTVMAQGVEDAVKKFNGFIENN